MIAQTIMVYQNCRPRSRWSLRRSITATLICVSLSVHYFRSRVSINSINIELERLLTLTKKYFHDLQGWRHYYPSGHTLTFEEKPFRPSNNDYVRPAVFPISFDGSFTRMLLDSVSSCLLLLIYSCRIPLSFPYVPSYHRVDNHSYSMTLLHNRSLRSKVFPSSG